MQQKPKTGRRKLELADGRSLMAGTAFLITGVIVALMVDNYVNTPAGSNAVTRSRLWWEIVLNLQILSAGMVWYCYVDRISDAEGAVRRSYILLCFYSILAVLMPSFLGAMSAANNWFEIRPSTESFIGFFVFGVIFWFVSMLSQQLLYLFKRRRGATHARKSRVRDFLPAMALVVVIAIDAPRGGNLWLVMTPVLLYIQGGLPYLRRAIKLRPVSERVLG